MKRTESLRIVTAITLIALALSATAVGQTSSEFGSGVRQAPRGAFDSSGVAPVAPLSRTLQLASPLVTLSTGNLQLSSDPPAPVVDADANDYSWLLDQLQQKRQKATANLRAQQQATANHDTAGGRQHRRIHELRRNYEDQDSQLQDREQRVNRQLGRLERLLREHEMLKRNSSKAVLPEFDPSPEQPTPPPTEAAEQPTNPQNGEMITKPIANQAEAVESDTEPAENVVDQAESPTKTSPPFSASQVDAISLTNQTVDSLALANNLYGTGEYSLALKIYSKVDQSEMVPEDKIWIRFQIANCHRQLGSFKEAQRGYRVVTSAAADSWIGHTARWWLEATDKTARLKDRIKNLQANYEQLRKEVDEPNLAP